MSVAVAIEMLLLQRDDVGMENIDKGNGTVYSIVDHREVVVEENSLLKKEQAVEIFAVTERSKAWRRVLECNLMWRWRDVGRRRYRRPM